MRKISIFLISIIIGLCSYGQQDTFAFTTSSYFVPNIIIGDTMTITDTMYVYGSGTLTLTNLITFAARVNSTRIDSTPFFPSPPFFAAGDTFNPNDQFRVTFHIVDSTPPFVVGPNIVVIWPVYLNNGSQAILGPPNDSIFVYTYYYPLGIAQSPLSRMYIFETPGHLNINFGEAENQVQQVRIYNIIGQSMYADTPDRSKNIPTAGWSMGIYLCEITTLSGEKRTFKFRLE